MANPDASSGLVPLNAGSQRGEAPRVGHARLRGGRRPIREPLPVAQHSGVGHGGELRSAFRAHAELLEPAAGRYRRNQRSRPVARRCLPERVHLHPDRPERQRPEHRRQRVRVRVRVTTSSASWSISSPRDTSPTPTRCSSRRATSVGSQAQYQDGVWTYAWPWAIYLMKTGDLSFVKKNFASEGPGSPTTEHQGHGSRDRQPTGPGPRGSWSRPTTSTPTATGPPTTTKPCWAWPPTATSPARRGPSRGRLGDPAVRQPAVGNEPDARRNHQPLRLGLPALLDPRAQQRQQVRESRGRQLDVAVRFRCAGRGTGLSSERPLNGPGISLIDATYAYGFQRLEGMLPPNTFGGFPGDYYSTGYNAGNGSAGLASTAYRDQGILSYEFMIENSQSGPYSWWESSSAPSASTPWIGNHPDGGPRLLSPRVGDVPGEQGPVGLTGGAEIGRHLDRGPRRPCAMAGSMARRSRSPTSPPPTAGG